MLSENKFNMLIQRVVFDHEILTHRVVARSFKVDTTSAKKLLAEFVARSDGRAHATYILTGFMKTGASPSLPDLAPAENGLLTSSNESESAALPSPAVNGDAEMANGDEDAPVLSSAPPAGSSSQAYMTDLKTQEEAPLEEFECVMLAPQEELAEKVSLFSKLLSQEVYSVEPSRLPDLVLLTDANAPVLKDSNLAAIDADVLGTIKHYRTKLTKSGKSSKPSTSASTLDKPKDKAKAKESEKASSSTNNPYLKRKASATEIESKTANKSASSSKAPSPAATTKDKGKEKEKVTTSKNGGPSLDDLFKSDVKQTKEPSAAPAKKLSKQSSKQAVEDDDFDDMLADDDDMMAELDALENDKSSKVTSQKASKPSSQSKKSDASKTEKKDRPTLQSGSRRRTRKVMKKVQEVNAKGYKVTKEVETEEEYTASDSEDDGPVVASSSTAFKASKAAKEKEKEKETTEKPKSKAQETAKEKPAEKPKLEKKPSSSKIGASSSQAKPKAGAGGQTSLAGFFGKPKPKK